MSNESPPTPKVAALTVFSTLALDRAVTANAKKRPYLEAVLCFLGSPLLAVLVVLPPHGAAAKTSSGLFTGGPH